MFYSKISALLFLTFFLLSCSNGDNEISNKDSTLTVQKNLSNKDEILDSITNVSDSNVVFYRNSQVEEVNSILSDTSSLVLEKLEKKFDEFLKTVSQITIDGVKMYVVQGDELYTLDRLHSEWLYNESKKFKNLDSTLFFDIGSMVQNKMIVITDPNNNPLTWAKNTILKFSILKNTFPYSNRNELYNSVRNNLSIAIRDWNSLCNVKFEYHSEFDNNTVSTSPPSGITFTVEYHSLGPGDDPNTIAISFYKNDLINRKVRVCPNYFTDRTFNKAGIFRHELGHVLGLRHEQINSDAPLDCVVKYGRERTANTRAITSYDPNSVMHYLCGNFTNYDLSFTRLDTIGTQYLYGK